MEEKITLNLPKEFLIKLDKKVKEGDFGSRENYIKYILKQIVSEDSSESVFTKEESKMQEKKLRDLGYL